MFYKNSKKQAVIYSVLCVWSLISKCLCGMYSEHLFGQTPDPRYKVIFGQIVQCNDENKVSPIKKKPYKMSNPIPIPIPKRKKREKNTKRDDRFGDS